MTRRARTRRRTIPCILSKRSRGRWHCQRQSQQQQEEERLLADQEKSGPHKGERTNERTYASDESHRLLLLWLECLAFESNSPPPANNFLSLPPLAPLDKYRLSSALSWPQTELQDDGGDPSPPVIGEDDDDDDDDDDGPPPRRVPRPRPSPPIPTSRQCPPTSPPPRDDGAG